MKHWQLSQLRRPKYMNAFARIRVRKRTRTKVHTAALTAIVAAGMTLPLAAGEPIVLHDTMWMTEDESFDESVISHIAAHSPGFPSFIRDRNTSDDFTVPAGNGYQITSVTGDFVSNGSWGGEAVLVELFADVEGIPSNFTTAQFYATLENGLSVSSFSNDNVAPDVLTNGIRFTVDLSNAGIELAEGTWWLSIVAVHETTPSQVYRWIRTTNYQEGGVVHVRDGGEAHGNGYSGGWGTTDWTPINEFGTNLPGDVAMRIEGTSIELQCAEADLNCDGVVNVSDLLLLLACWGDCFDCNDCCGDLDDDCTVNVSDLLILLAMWG